MAWAMHFFLYENDSSSVAEAGGGGDERGGFCGIAELAVVAGGFGFEKSGESQCAVAECGRGAGASRGGKFYGAASGEFAEGWAEAA